MKLPKIYLSSDSPFNLDVISCVLSLSKEIELVDKLNLHDLAVNQTIREFDILIVDISEQTESDELKQIFQQYKDRKILIVTSSKNHFFLSSLLHMGASGCFIKSSNAKDFIHAIIDLHLNNAYLPSSLFNRLFCELPTKFNNGVHRHSDFTNHNVPILDIDTLTSREREIVRLLVAGESSSMIAKDLFISEMTVNTHRKHIYKKLGINNTSTLIRCALEQHIF